MDIFWPTLESIYAVKQRLADHDREENDILKNLIDSRSLIDIEPVLQRQRELSVLKEELEAEVKRKWNLIHAGCAFIAMILNEGQTGRDERLTPEVVYRAMIEGENMHGPIFATHVS